MKRISIVLLTGLAAGLLAAQSREAAARVGSIAGRVVDEVGVGIMGAEVHYRMQTKFARSASGKPVVVDIGPSGMVASGVEGRFLIEGLRDGSYEVCALVREAKLLNPVGSCWWEPTGVVEVKEDARTSGVTRKVYQGVRLTFRVNDARRQISAVDSKQQALDFDRRFYVGIVNRWGIYLAAQLVGTAKEEKSYEVLVPRGEEMRVFVDSDLTVTDSRGVDLERRRLSSLAVQSGYAEQAVVELTVP